MPFSLPHTRPSSQVSAGPCFEALSKIGCFKEGFSVSGAENWGRGLLTRNTGTCRIILASSRILLLIGGSASLKNNFTFAFFFRKKLHVLTVWYSVWNRWFFLLWEQIWQQKAYGAYFYKYKYISQVTLKHWCQGTKSLHPYWWPLYMKLCFKRWCCLMVNLNQHNNGACYNTVLQLDNKIRYVQFKIHQGDFKYHFLHECC